MERTMARVIPGIEKLAEVENQVRAQVAAERLRRSQISIIPSSPEELRELKKSTGIGKLSLGGVR